MPNKTKKILIILIILILIFLVFLIFKNTKDNNSEEGLTSNEDVQKEIITYSRINFFLTTPNKASLVIPDYWEGKYRIREEGNKASFYFVSKENDEIELFSIIHKEKDSLNQGEENYLILEKNNQGFLLIMAENKNIEENIYYRMFDDIKDLMESFKVS